MEYLRLFFEFFKIGLFAVGGGLATLPFLGRLAAGSAWLAAAEIPAMLAIAQLLPGAIGVNLASQTGARISILGSYIALLGLITPQIAIITLISRLSSTFKKSALVERAYNGLFPAAAGLLAAAGFELLKAALYNDAAENSLSAFRFRETALFLAFFILIRLLKKLHPIVFIAAGAALGIALKL